MKWFHFHKWKLVAATPFESIMHGYWLGGIFMPIEPAVKSEKTKVLYKCACGQFKTEDLDGVWYLSTLQNTPAQP